MDSPPAPTASVSASRPLKRVSFPPTWHAVIFGSVLVGLAVLVILTMDALGPYIIALVIVFLMNGLVDRLARAGLPRWAGTLLAILALIVAIVLFVYVILDAVIEQLATLKAGLPELAAQTADWLVSLQLPPGVYEGLASWVDGLPASLPGLIANAFGFVLTGVAGIVAFVIAVAGIPFWIFYALSDSPALLVGLRKAVPASYRDAVFDILAILGDVFGAWARSMALIAGVVGVAFFIGFLIFGALIDPVIGQYALLFAVILAISELVPVIGPVIAIIPILIITAVTAGPVGVLAVGILFVVIEQIDGSVIQPRVQGHELDLHPAVILPALVVGSALAGLMGAILVLPLTAAARQTVAYLLRVTGGEQPAEPA